MSTYQICLLPGDGIGPEVISQARNVLESLTIKWKFITAPIGFAAFQQLGTPLPETTLTSISTADASLFGAVTTPPNIQNYFSPVVRMRQELELYANLRPIQSIPHPNSKKGIDLLIVRENTEGLYSGIERLEANGKRAITERIITRESSRRVIDKAFQIAQEKERQKVTVVHKANVLRQTCGLFRQVALEMASCYPEIQMEEMLVDTCAMELIRAPEQFDVIVTTNLFGDIISDEAAMLVGGLGVAYSGNIGDHAAVFEPVHGSAPNLVGTGKANPIAAILSAAMMLDYLEENDQANRVRTAVFDTIESGSSTEDMGGNLPTHIITQEIIKNIHH